MDMWDAYASSRKPLEGEPKEKMKRGTSLGEPIHQAAGLERPDREDFSHKALRHDQDIRDTLASTSSGKKNGLASGTGSKPTIKNSDLEKAHPPAGG